MGLDITWYRRLTKAAPGEGIDPKYPDDYDYANGYKRLYKNNSFPGRADEIEDRAIYRAEESDGFRAGSYSGYNTWRDQLAELSGAYAETMPSPGEYAYGRMSFAAGAWRDEVTEGPFYELLNFSDCEGVIGAAVSAKLARDFAALQEKADAHPDEYFRAKYREWRKAFEMAADGGAVEFH